jgi:hypothetical protein
VKKTPLYNLRTETNSSVPLFSGTGVTKTKSLKVAVFETSLLPGVAKKSGKPKKVFVSCSLP